MLYLVTLVHGTSASESQDDVKEVFIQVEGECPSHSSVEVSLSTTLASLRTLISEQLDEFEFDYKFLKQAGFNFFGFFIFYTLFIYLLSGRLAVIALKQESIKTVEDLIDGELNVTVRKTG
jgi:hypothetical protein